MNFQKITLEDREEVLEMMDEFYHSEAVDHEVSPHIHELTFKELVSDSPFLEGFLFVREGQKVGYAILSKQFAVEVGGISLWIEDVYVRENYRGYGIGKAFLTWVQTHYQVPRLRLEVTPDNHQAKALYTRLGFTQLNYEQMIFE